MPDVRIVSVAPRAFAGVRRAVRRSEIPPALISSLDIVWSVIRRARFGGHGHNIAVYRDIDAETVEMECGVEIGGSFAPEGEVVILETPAGMAVSATHAGPVQHLGATYRLVFEWLHEHGVAPAGVRWEVYGDPDEQTGEFEVELFVLVGPWRPPLARTP